MTKYFLASKQCKNWKKITLCLIFPTNWLISAGDTNLQKLTYMMGVASVTAIFFSESKSEKIVRGTYFGMATSGLAMLLNAKHLDINEKRLAVGLAFLPLVSIIKMSEDFLAYINKRLNEQVYTFNQDIDSTVKSLIQAYKQIEIRHIHPEIYGDYSDLVIKFCQDCAIIDIKKVQCDIKKLNKLIKNSAEKNYATKDPFVFNAIVEYVRILKIIAEKDYYRIVRTCFYLMQIQQRYAQKTTTFYADDYLATLKQDCQDLQDVIQDISQTNFKRLQIIALNLLVHLRSLKADLVY